MREWSERQKEIIEKSIKIISELGIQDFTTKNLAKEMNFSEAAIYKHFPGKVEIILAILTLFDQQADEILVKIKQVEKPGFNEIFEIFKNRCAMFERKPYYANVIFSEEIFQNDVRFKEKILGIMKKHRKLILDILKQMIEDGKISRIYHENELATIIMGSFRLLVTQWRLSHFQFPLREYLENLFAALKKMMVLE